VHRRDGYHSIQGVADTTEPVTEIAKRRYPRKDTRLLFTLCGLLEIAQADTHQGMHYITVEGWDSAGQFSRSLTITVPWCVPPSALDKNRSSVWRIRPYIKV
jgi:hypothetical protein